MHCPNAQDKTYFVFLVNVVTIMLDILYKLYYYINILYVFYLVIDEGRRRNIAGGLMLINDSTILQLPFVAVSWTIFRWKIVLYCTFIGKKKNFDFFCYEVNNNKLTLE